MLDENIKERLKILHTKQRVELFEQCIQLYSKVKVDLYFKIKRSLVRLVSFIILSG